MNDAALVKIEEQQRGQAFLQAYKRLQEKYNCTVTTTPKWLPLMSRTRVLGFDEQVMVGPVPLPAQTGLPAPPQTEMKPVEDEGDA